MRTNIYQQVATEDNQTLSLAPTANVSISAPVGVIYTLNNSPHQYYMGKTGIMNYVDIPITSITFVRLNGAKAIVTSYGETPEN